MATFYVDLENGNDSNNGTTFALRKKTLSTITASAGDEVRVMASPSATSLGQTAKWNNRIVTSRTITSSTNATPISITTSSTHDFSTGDTVCLTGHTGNTNANGTWKITVTGASTFTLNGSVGTGVGSSGTVLNITGKTVELTTAVTQTIASTGGSGTLPVGNGNRGTWSGVTNVTVTAQTATTKESNIADQFAVAGGFTTGKIAFRNLSTTLNLSGYQQVSFWIMQTTGTLATDGNLRLRLCSDTNGDTVVNTINVPAIAATNNWYPITVNLGTNLGSSIQSVSFALTTDQGAQTFRVCNIFASKAASSADSLTLQSLIGKDDGRWYHIQSIDGTRVILDSGSNTYPTSVATQQRTYTGTTETVTTYKKETIKATATVTGPAGSGTLGNLITVSGGWNRTNMSTQEEGDETWIDGQYIPSNTVAISVKSFHAYTNFSASRGGISSCLGMGGITGCEIDFNNINCHNPTSVASVSLTGTSVGNLITIANVEFIQGNAVASLANTAKGNTYGFDIVSSVSGVGFNCCDTGSTVITIGEMINNGTGIEIGGSNNVFQSIGTIRNGTTAIRFSVTNAGSSTGTRIENLGELVSNSNAFSGIGLGSVYIANGSTTGHTSTLITASGNAPTYFRNVTFNEDIGSWFLRAYFLGDSAFVMDNNAGVDYTFGEFGYIATNTAVRHTASGKSWSFNPTNSLRDSNYPLRLPVAQAYVEADAEVTVTAWLRRDNINLQMQLVAQGGQLAGVDKTTADLTAAVDTWQQVTLTFTPEESGVIEIECLGWTTGGTTNIGYLDDISITQA
jgi:hypothetical protein